jgi:hypothetical protein
MTGTSIDRGDLRQSCANSRGHSYQVVRKIALIGKCLDQLAASPEVYRCGVNIEYHKIKRMLKNILMELINLLNAN